MRRMPGGPLGCSWSGPGSSGSRRPVVAAGADLDREHVRPVAGGGAPRVGVELVLGDDDHRAAGLAGRRPWRPRGSAPARRRRPRPCGAPLRARRHRERVGQQPVDLDRAPAAAVGGRRAGAEVGKPSPRSVGAGLGERDVGGEAEAVAERAQRRLGADPQHLDVDRAGADDAAREPADLLRPAPGPARRAGRRARPAWPPGRRRAGSHDRASAARRRTLPARSESVVWRHGDLAFRSRGLDRTSISPAGRTRLRPRPAGRAGGR